MTTATRFSERPAIEYPDSDGLPMADNTLQYEWIVTIKGGLDATFVDAANVFVAGDLLWYPVEGEPTIRSAPDAMVAFGRPKGYRGSYKQWEEEGVAPQAVFEVLSPGNRPREMIRKFQFYERYGVEEYYIYNPDSGALDGWLRRGDRLEEISDIANFVSPRLGIRFDPGPGPDNLRIFGPDGAPFLTFAEWVERSKSDQRRAEAAAMSAEEQTRLAVAERQRADDERARAERLAARLRELGIEPDGV
jgi:Uma2 family endonuclease